MKKTRKLMIVLGIASLFSVLAGCATAPLPEAEENAQVTDEQGTQTAPAADPAPVADPISVTDETLVLESQAASEQAPAAQEQPVAKPTKQATPSISEEVLLKKLKVSVQFHHIGGGSWSLDLVTGQVSEERRASANSSGPLEKYRYLMEQKPALKQKLSMIQATIFGGSLTHSELLSLSANPNVEDIEIICIFHDVAATGAPASENGLGLAQVTLDIFVNLDSTRIGVTSQLSEDEIYQALLKARDQALPGVEQKVTSVSGL